ncbi:DgyrCDS159 [Dimorphilus gyrociliatus]|uniref:DgyrCDS159 n=1 Tax=Dimorphilus gyrociliatus TaxID=2664684 RepID=A0A7I8V408_9ANNE|nr:DgyrCDS159 [Dimorphilus gyrociliatus]
MDGEENGRSASVSNADGGKKAVPLSVNYKIEDKLASQYQAHNVINLSGSELNLAYFQKNGFTKPISINDKSGLGLRVPSQNFTVADVKACVGSLRTLNVVDSDTRSSFIMMVKDWVEYYVRPEKVKKKFSVTSLEFTHTKLSTYVEAPTAVQQIDWANCVWPIHQRDSQNEENTSIPDRNRLPKVQKFCAMSVKGCFGDFHIDMSGCSTWYHVLHGSKIFWILPPTQYNLDAFEKWVKSGKQEFFAEKGKECQKFTLKEGQTFLLPSGWIHAIYSEEDSLVFSGNFLHSFSIPQQIKIAELEKRIYDKFNYSFFTEIMWYAVKRYCGALLNPPLTPVKETSGEETDTEKKTPTTSPMAKSTSSLPENGSCKKEIKKETKGENDQTEEEPKTEKATIKDENNKVPMKIYLTTFELEGLECLIEWLEKSNFAAARVPIEFHNAQLLLKKLQDLLDNHRNDAADLAITNEPILSWTFNKRPRAASRVPNSLKRGRGGSRVSQSSPSSAGVDQGSGDKSKGPQHRRVRCKKCEPCTRTDCGECHFCRDMRKFGGLGRMKQTCVSRQCMVPLLPSTAICHLCESGDGREAPACLDDIKEANDLLMECSICWKISHPRCLSSKDSDLPCGSLCDDMPACWRCPECIRCDGKPIEEKRRIGKENKIPPPVLMPILPTVNTPPTPKCTKMLSFNDYLKARPADKKSRSKVEEEKPKFVVRPAPITPPPLYVELEDGKNHVLDRNLWQTIFGFLDSKSMVNIMSCCKTFCKWTVDRRFWYYINVNQKCLSRNMLTGIIRRQPSALNLTSTNISRVQLEWLLKRLPCLEHLFLSSNSVAACSALRSVPVTRLRTLDLSWIDGLNDDTLKMIIPPISHTSSLKIVSGLALNGTEVTDSVLGSIVRYMNILVKLELTYCPNITDDILGQLADAETLSHVGLTGCPCITDKVLNGLFSVPLLTILEVNYCKNVTVSACHAAMRTMRQNGKCITICCGQNESPYARLVDMVPELIDT